MEKVKPGLITKADELFCNTNNPTPKSIKSLKFTELKTIEPCINYNLTFEIVDRDTNQTVVEDIIGDYVWPAEFQFTKTKPLRIHCHARNVGETGQHPKLR